MRSVKKGVLRNFAKLTGKHLCQSLFFILKLQAPPFSQNTSGRLVLLCIVNIAFLSGIIFSFFFKMEKKFEGIL